MTKRERVALVKFLIRKKKEFNKYQEKHEKFKADMISDLDYICRTIVDDFYSDYMPKGSDPIYYVRKYSLYDAYKITINDEAWDVDEGPEYMNKEIHGEFTEYIYDIAFVRGYHGGATSGDGHPASGIPYWRTPFPTFDSWGRPAAISKSPYMRMEKECQDYFRIKEAEWERTIYKPVEQLYYEVEQRVLSVL